MASKPPMVSADPVHDAKAPAPATTVNVDATAKDQPKPKTIAKYFIHSQRIFEGIAVVNVVLLLLAIRFFRPGFFSTILYILLGLPIGVVWSFMHFQRARSKSNVTKLMNVDPGVKGMKYLVSCMPTWCNMSDNERAEWLNKVLLEVWPFYDYAVCEVVKESVDPIFDQVKPPLLIKSLGFKTLQFGDAPIRIENVRMDRSRPKTEIVLEIDFRHATRMCPKISQLRCTGTLGIIMKPLVDEIPGFGAVLVTLMKPPKISYRVDLGKAMGGSVLGSAIGSFVNNLLPTILNGFLVWPQRIVVPILPESVTGPLDYLQLRHQGILKVTLIEAKDIPRMDQMGLSDPFVRLFTDTKRVLKTTTKKNTLHPVWKDEVHYLMVQEPQSQDLRWEMFDIDMLNVKSLFKLNVVKGLKEAVHNESSMCKGATSLREFTAAPHIVHDKWFHLGPDDWSADDGPGKGLGMIHFHLQYVPFEANNPLKGDFGALFVRVRQASDFPPMDPGNPTSCNAYYEVKIDKHEKHRSTVRPGTLSPDWSWELKDFYGIPNEEILKIKFLSQNALTSDESIGRVQISIASVRESTHNGQPGCLLKEYELEDADSGRVFIECLFISYF